MRSPAKRNRFRLVRIARRLIAVAALLLMAASAAAAAADSEPIHIASNGWHAALVVRREAVPEGLLPEIRALPPSPYVEIGWGDREYFPKPDPGLADAVAAGLFPGPAVMHLVALGRPPAEAFPRAEVVTLRLEAAAFETLLGAVDADIERSNGGTATPVAPGLHPGRSQFYPAKGRFHAFNTCNTWTARTLAAAGVAVSPDGVKRSEELMAQLRALPGARVRPALPE